VILDEPRSSNARIVDLLCGISGEQAFYIIEHLGLQEREHLFQALCEIHLGVVGQISHEDEVY